MRKIILVCIFFVFSFSLCFSQEKSLTENIPDIWDIRMGDSKEEVIRKLKVIGFAINKDSSNETSLVFWPKELITLKELQPDLLNDDYYWALYGIEFGIQPIHQVIVVFNENKCYMMQLMDGIYKPTIEKMRFEHTAEEFLKQYSNVQYLGEQDVNNVPTKVYAIMNRYLFTVGLGTKEAFFSMYDVYGE